MGSAGVAIALFLTIYLLPLLLELWPPVRKQPRAGFELAEQGAAKFSGGVAKKAGCDRSGRAATPARVHRAVSRAAGCVCLWRASGQGRLDLLSLYPKDSPFSTSVKLLDEKMAGSNQMSIYMDFGASRAAEDPVVLQAIDDLQRQFERKYPQYVVTTSSLVDIVKDTYQKLNQAQAAKYVVPADPRELSQTLYLFNNADPEQRKRLVDDNYRKAAVTVTLRNAGTFEYGDVFDSMQRDIQASLSTIRQHYPQAQVSITGMFVLKMRLDHSPDHDRTGEFRRGLSGHQHSVLLRGVRLHQGGRDRHHSQCDSVAVRGWRDGLARHPAGLFRDHPRADHHRHSRWTTRLTS